MSECEALSVATISGFTPASRFSRASRVCRESRGVPGTTICPIPVQAPVRGMQRRMDYALEVNGNAQVSAALHRMPRVMTG
jgi:hypothetical protein